MILHRILSLNNALVYEITFSLVTLQVIDLHYLLSPLQSHGHAIFDRTVRSEFIYL